LSQSLRVMVVDDARTNRIVFEAMLKKMGHEPILAESGEEAIELFKQSQPDVVLMDVMMPGMSGYDTVKQMRRLADSWIPIVFVSAMGENQDIVRGIQIGADDYLIKPVNYNVLEIKIQSLYQRIQMAQQLADQNKILLEHRAKAEEEGQLAQEFMRRLAALDKISDPLLDFHLTPAEDFSGDLIAVARTPAGQLHVMLADSTGHGLTSALAVMPVLQPFQVMSSKGFSIAAIAGEINQKVKAYLPHNRFVAAVLLSLDVERGVVEVWNGGCPPAVVMDESGATVCQFISRHVPLGILSQEEFDDAVEHHFYDGKPCQVVLCSDGALDCLESDSLKSAMEQLMAVAKTVSPDRRLAAMQELLDERREEMESRDDIALIVVNCSQPLAEELSGEIGAHTPIADKSVAAGEMSGEVEWEFSLTLTAAQLKRLDVVPMLLGLANQIEPGNAALSGKLFLVMSELFNNALDHGLLKLDSTLKHDPSGMERYYEQRNTRLKLLGTGEITVRLAKGHYDGQACIQMVFRDSGEGFDHKDVESGQEGSVTEQRHGRGISLVKNLCQEVEYLRHGAEVHVRMALS